MAFPPARTTRLLTAAVAALSCAAAAPALAVTGPGSDPVKGFGHVEGLPALVDKLGVPFDPADPDPAEAAAAAALGSPGTPESDLAAALDSLAAASSAEQAQAAAQLALDILEGNPIAKKVYSGIPLLNWNAPARVQTVPPGGTVTIRQVRWGEHTLSDTALLRFDAPDQAFKIRYRVSALGTAAGSELTPTPLLRNVDGTALGGQHSAIQPLAIDQVPTGTHQGSRFTRDRGIADPGELTRAATQDITVTMPPPGRLEAILEPNLRAGNETAAALLPATDARLAALGFDAASTPEANKARAIGMLANTAPEKQIWSALQALPATTDSTYVGAAQTAGRDLRGLVGAMRSRSELPTNVSPAGADATVVLQNNEAYLSQRSVRLAAGGSLTIKVVNLDGFAHSMKALDLHDRNRIFGADDWGEFSWLDRPLIGADPLVPAGETRIFTVTPANGAFTLWIGDLESGDQAHAAIALERGIRQEALRFGAPTLPVHAAPDAAGNVWVTLAGVDTIAKVTPSHGLAASLVERFPLPGGRHEIDSPLPPLGPADITVDGRGIVWATLASGNAIARIDPARTRNGSTDGIKIMPLETCTTAHVPCQPEIPPIPNEQPTRRPTRIKSMIDGNGHTVLWFVEAAASGIGVLRVDQLGNELNQAHFQCGCSVPESLDLGPDGSIWYTQIFENRIGRLRPDPTRPYSSSAGRIEHYEIPREAEVFDAAAPGGVAMTSLPLSIAVDGRDLVWFSMSAMGAVAHLDPAQAIPGANMPQQEVGFTEVPLPDSDFRSPAAPADVTVDRANNFWWAGEYGDQIEQLHPDGTQGHRFRGSARRGLTEGPVADVHGNLWVVESGANLLTRISGVTEGPLRPFGLPAGLEADVTRDVLTGERLRDATTVAVQVTRGASVVASATATVTGGAFTISGGQWNGVGAGDPLRADDIVRIQPHGSFARAPLSYRVADLSAVVQDNGWLAGHARADARALSDRVTVSVGDRVMSAGIDGADGSWRIVPPTPLPASTGATIAWSGATVAGTFRTVGRFSTPAPPSAPPPALPPVPQPPTPFVSPPPPAAPPSAPAISRPVACTKRQWLYGTASRPRVLLLGLTTKDVAICLGIPSEATLASNGRSEVWRYGQGLQISFRNGRVTTYRLRDRRLRASRNGATVGSSLPTLRRALPRLRRDPRSGLQRTLLAQPGGSYADVEARVSGGRVRSITVTLERTRTLDAFGRTLLRIARQPRGGSA